MYVGFRDKFRIALFTRVVDSVRDRACRAMFVCDAHRCSAGSLIGA
jgi:hypothetical protein